MALENFMFWDFRYQAFHINKSQPLGHGSYGAVYRAKCDQLTCAAKILHPTILDIEDLGSGKIMEKFRQECTFLESIRHPHIVQYLGVTTDPDSRLPVLLMELLDESLTKMLEHSAQPPAYHVQVDICHDIALAVAYLHSNDIIHRDLSSNNVLIIAKRKAKVTDFGMSKLADSAPITTPLTMCPGTLAYMPPEALREPPRYTKKLDCFSEGVIMIQVCTRHWPEPGPRTQVIRDSRSPTGIVEMPVPETERRKSHIDLIDSSNDLLSISVDCLQFEDIDRPSSDEICQRISILKESTKYRESVQQQQDAIQARDRQIRLQSERLHSMENEIQPKDDQLQEKDRKLERKQDELNELDTALQQKEHWRQQERELQQRQLQ
jgi:serine/threonine protein kinase